MPVDGRRHVVELHVVWYGVTDTVVLIGKEDGQEPEELCEVPRVEWQKLVDAIRAGDTKMPWEAVKVTLE